MEVQDEGRLSCSLVMIPEVAKPDNLVKKKKSYSGWIINLSVNIFKSDGAKFIVFRANIASKRPFLSPGFYNLLII